MNRACALCAALFIASLFCFSQTPATSVPRVVRFSGTVTNADGTPRTGMVGVMFSLYKQQQGGSALWTELQNVQLDANGNYTVLLGAQHSDGVPAELFTTNEARWLGIQVEADAEQPRILLVSVPYALKAGDAETLGGYTLAQILGGGTGGSGDVIGAAAGQTITLDNATRPTRNSTVTAPVKGPGVRTRTSESGSGILEAYDDSTNTPLALLLNPSGGNVGIGTTAPSQRLSVAGVVESTSGGFKYPDGSVQTTAQTITSVTAGSGLSGGGSSGNVTVSIANGGVTNGMLANSGLTITAPSGSGLSGGGSAALGGSVTVGLVTCPAGQILKSAGTSWSCGADVVSNAGGSVTQINTGSGLSGGPLTTSGTLSVDATVVPLLAANNLWSGSNAFVGGVENMSAAAATLPVKAVAAAAKPATCSATRELILVTDAAAGQQLYICNSSGDGWVIVGDGGGTAPITATQLDTAAVTSSKIAADAVTTDKIADAAVTATKIADGSVSSQKMADGAVGQSNLADGAVTGTKLADGSVSTQKMVDDSVTTEKIADAAVTTNKIADTSVTNGKMAADAVDTTNLKNGAVSTDKLANTSVTNGKMATDAVAGTNLQNAAVTTAKIADGAVTNAKLGAIAIDSTKLADSAVTTTKLMDKAVTSQKLADGAAGNQQIAAGAVTSDKLADAAVSTQKMADAAVTAAKLSAMGCTSGQVLKSSGTGWACGADSVGGVGTVTSITAGTGLTANTVAGASITATGTLAIDTTVIPRLAAANSFSSTNSFTGTGVLNAASAAHTTPTKVGTIAALPATCGTGEMYFASDATAGRNWYYCTATNTWTAQATGLTGTVAIASGGTGITTGPTAAGQFLRSSGSGAWAVANIAPGDLPSLNGAYVDLGSNQTIGGTKTFSNTIAANISGSAAFASTAGGLNSPYTSQIAFTNSSNAFAGTFSGNGYALTSLNGANLLAGSVPNSATSATTAATANSMVERDGLGGISAESVSIADGLILGGFYFAHAHGTNNTALGQAALINLTNASYSNTAVGLGSLYSNTDGAANTAVGEWTLSSNTIGNYNTAMGRSALSSLSSGERNTGIGNDALGTLTSGSSNIAVGDFAMGTATIANDNTAIGASALFNATGDESTAVGFHALVNSTGSNNIAIGSQAGSSLTSGANSIEIGNLGANDDSGVIRIGTPGTHNRTYIAGIRGVTTGVNNAVPVLIDGNGQLGVTSSSGRYKEDVGSSRVDLQACKLEYSIVSPK